MTELGAAADDCGKSLWSADASPADDRASQLTLGSEAGCLVVLPLESRNARRAQYTDPAARHRGRADLHRIYPAMKRLLTWAAVVALTVLLIGLIVTGALLSHRPR